LGTTRVLNSQINGSSALESVTPTKNSLRRVGAQQPQRMIIGLRTGGTRGLPPKKEDWLEPEGEKKFGAKRTQKNTLGGDGGQSDLMSEKTHG